MTNVLRTRGEDTEKNKEEGHLKTGRARSDVATSQGTLETTRSG